MVGGRLRDAIRTDAQARGNHEGVMGVMGTLGDIGTLEGPDEPIAAHAQRRHRKLSIVLEHALE